MITNSICFYHPRYIGNLPILLAYFGCLFFYRINVVAPATRHLRWVQQSGLRGGCTYRRSREASSSWGDCFRLGLDTPSPALPGTEPPGRCTPGASVVTNALGYSTTSPRNDMPLEIGD